MVYQQLELKLWHSKEVLDNDCYSGLPIRKQLGLKKKEKKKIELNQVPSLPGNIFITIARMLSCLYKSFITFPGLRARDWKQYNILKNMP